MIGGLPAGSRILDAGAGELQYMHLCSHLDYVSQDFGKYDGVGDGTGKQTGSWDQSKIDIICDITRIPQPDMSFDAVMCVEVLEHLPDPIRALGEFARLLRNGGLLILTAPFCSMTHYSPYFYYTGYSENFYRYWLEKMGFTLDRVEWNGSYFEYLAQELKRLPNVANRYSTYAPSFVEKAALRMVHKLLIRVARTDKGSEEILAFGLHILARRT